MKGYLCGHTLIWVHSFLFDWYSRGKNMFTKNDRFLKTARVLADVSFVLGLIVSFTLGIVYTVVLKNALFLLILPGGAFFSWTVWIFVWLWLSLCCDVKFIRNKLYGNSNNNLKELFDEEYKVKGRHGNSEREPDYLAKEVERLNRLFDSGAISQEEYNREIMKLLNK